jgi:hypothetical protein
MPLWYVSRDETLMATFLSIDRKESIEAVRRFVDERDIDLAVFCRPREVSQPPFNRTAGYLNLIDTGMKLADETGVSVLLVPAVHRSSR